MNPKTLTGLVIAALIVIAAAIAINHSRRPEGEAGAQPAQLLLPDLGTHVNGVDKIVLTGAGDKILATLARGKAGWSVVEKNGYAADFGKVRTFLLKLADATVLEQKTADKAKYATLGVDDVADKDAKGVQVELGGLPQPLRLVVGNYNGQGEPGTFVRKAGDAQSWLVKGTLTVDKNAADWLQKDLADIPSTRIQSVTITRADGKTVRVAKNAAGDANFILADVPKGREPGAQYTLNELGSVLANLGFDDVLPAKDAAPGENPVRAHYAAFDGLAIDATTWSKDGKDYAQFAAAVDPTVASAYIGAQQAKAKSDYEARLISAQKEAAAAKPTTGAPGEPRQSGTAEPDSDAEAASRVAIDTAKPLSVGDPAKDRADRLAALNKEVAGLNARFTNWTFVLAPYKFANMDKSMDELLKPIETKKTEPLGKGEKPRAKMAKPPPGKRG